VTTYGRALATGVHAAELRASIARDPLAPVVAGVQGPGGYGKTTLLGELAAVYRDAGVPVLRAGSDPLDGHDGAAVLADDAHRLPDDVLRELREIADKPGARLIAAYRTWPRSEPFAELLSALGHGGPPVLLAPFGSEEIRQFAQRLLGGELPAEWIEWVRAQTGGVPRFVERLLVALNGVDRAQQPHVPRRALEQFHHDLDRLDEGARGCLAAIAVGATPHADLLASLLDLDPRTALNGLTAVRVSGLVDDNDVLLPIARQAVVQLTPWEQRLGVVRRLVEAQLRRGGPVLELVRPLLGSEAALVPEETLAQAFEQAGDEALAESPKLAERLFDAAVAAGRPVMAVAARKAHAAAAAGDFDEALRASEKVLVDDTAADRARGAQVAASALAHRGLLARSAEMCRWSVHNVRWPGDRAYAEVGLVGVGRREEADELANAPGDAGPPTSFAGAAKQLAEGVRESVTGSAASSLSTLVRSASLSEAVGRGILVPDTPAAVAAIVALHCGELDVAESTLDRAVQAGTGGAPLDFRHRLLAAWIPLVRGDTATARSRLLAATRNGNTMAVRDYLLVTAIEAGIANRENDMSALAAVRGHARRAVTEHPPDLFALLPLGELVVMAARLRDQDWLTPYLGEARQLLAKLGNPPLFTALLAWKCLQAAVVLEDLQAAHEHAAELAEVADHNPMSAAMSEAARTWLDVLYGKVDQAEAERAARGLHVAGLAWDGARLAGQAALRTSDRSTMLALLEVARALQGKPSRPRAVNESGGGSSSEILSEREKEVAELVLAGHTYKQVGQRLFISAKTVEHHIGRIKQRLGCSSREDLLAQLRQMLSE
jgi:DNA-binding CsgD family transcriptional regulator